LVVDDNRDGADSVVLLLEAWGHAAVAAYSQQHALAIAPEFDPDVVLMDIGLPDANGFDVANALKRCCPDARMVALTGFTRADLVQRARTDGFADYVVKGSPPDRLKHVVETQCAAVDD
jgi:CheY-like chemotaxis protein